MGNRAIIKARGAKIGLFLHWNGGVDSVTAFLKYCELRGFNGFPDTYALARLAQVCGNFFGGGLSVRIIEMSGEDTKQDAKGIENGIYIVNGWEIVDRIGNKCAREGYSRKGMLLTINEKQPKKEQLGEARILASI